MECNIAVADNQYNIRLADFNDCEQLSCLKRKVWETTYRGIYPDIKIDNYDYLENEKKFEKIINNEDVELYVVEYNSDLVGYMSCGKPIRPFRNYE